MSTESTILIVEDDDALRYLYRTAFAIGGFTVQEARNGLDALQRIDSDPPDVVLLDIGLPLIDGIAVRQDIGARKVTKHIPVVVVTASAEDLDWLDVDCIVRKPVSPDRLVDAVKDCLRDKR
jgi:twitching motility two-component system response regulator PilH